MGARLLTYGGILLTFGGVIINYMYFSMLSIVMLESFKASAPVAPIYKSRPRQVTRSTWLHYISGDFSIRKTAL